MKSEPSAAERADQADDLSIVPANQAPGTT